MPTRWLFERWQEFFPALEAAGNDEAKIAQVCQNEIALWRARPSLKEATSLRTPLTDTRNQIRETLRVTPENSWRNPRTNEREHLALKWLNVSEDEWARMNAPSRDRLQQRLEEQQLLPDPDGIVTVAAQLLRSKRWEELVVGLAATTGRRLAEVLKTGTIVPNTRYTVTFSGQLKRRDKALDPYEIPTLVEASQVLDAWQRLRSLLDCSNLSVEQITHDYGPKAREAADRWFKDLVPTREGHDDLYTHLFRCIYGRIAVFYFCPPRINDLQYLSQIYGHYWILNAETEEKRRHYLTTMHYNDYRLADASGNIDGRQGVKLGEPGVHVLEVFQPRISAPTVAAEPELESEPVELVPEGGLSVRDKKTHSIINVAHSTRQLYDQEAGELGTKGGDETIRELVSRSRLYRQLTEALAPLGKLLGTEHPVDTVVELQKQGVTPVRKGGRKAKEQRELEAFVSSLRQGGTENPIEYLRSLVEKDANFKKGLAKRHANVDYRSLTMDQLERIKTEGAATERLRRAVDAIMAHNAASEPLKRWYINAGAVRTLVGGRHEVIKAYLESRAGEIAQHHEKCGITPAFNRKPMSIKEMVQIEDEGSPSSGDETPAEAVDAG